MDRRAEQTGNLVLICPKSGAEVDTNTTYSAGDLRRARWASIMLYCDGCRKEHVFHFSDGRLKRTRRRPDGPNHNNNNHDTRQTQRGGR